MAESVRIVRPRRRVLSAVLGVSLALLAFEIALQLLAFALWTGGDRSAAELQGRRVVLCVGDSYTYGLGASDTAHAYPGRLEHMFIESGAPAWTVVNGAWPGRNSRDVLSRLPAQLRRFAPEVVCVLVGTNDGWTRPARLDADELIEAPAGFELRWRTGRFLALVGRWLGAGSDPAAPAFLGAWHYKQSEIRFDADGRLVADGIEFRWSLRDDGLFVEMPGRGELEIDWRIDGDELVVQSELWSDTTRMRRGPAPPTTPLDRGLRELRGGRAAAAVALLREAVADPASAVAGHEGLVLAHVALGDRPAAGASLDWLRRRHAEAGGPATEVDPALAQALAAFGELDEALRLSLGVIGAQPRQAKAWDVLFKQGQAADRRGTVLAAVQAALGSLPADDSHRGHLMILRARLLRADQPVDSLRSLLDALLAGAPEQFVAQELHFGRSIYNAAMLDRCMAEMAPDPESTARMRAAFARGMGGDGEVRATLRAHHEQIIAQCRARGAKVVLLTYPFRDVAHEAMVRDLALGSGVRSAEVRPVFDELLTTRTRDQLFVADGHCNDGGYATMAELVFEALRDRSR